MKENQEPVVSNLADKVLENLKNKKPRSKGYFLGLNLFWFLLILVLIVFLSFLLAFVFWDSWNLLQTKILTIHFFLFEFFLLVLFFLLLTFWLYRQTDFVLVKYRLLLFSALTCLVLLLGLLIFNLSWQNAQIKNRFEIAQEQVEKLPYRQNRKEVLKKLKEKGIFRGKLVKIQSKVSIADLQKHQIPKSLSTTELDNYSLVTLKNREETQVFLIKKDLLQELLNTSKIDPKVLQTNSEKENFWLVQIDRRDYQVDFSSKEIVSI